MVRRFLKGLRFIGLRMDILIYFVLKKMLSGLLILLSECWWNFIWKISLLRLLSKLFLLMRNLFYCMGWVVFFIFGYFWLGFNLLWGLFWLIFIFFIFMLFWLVFILMVLFFFCIWFLIMIGWLVLELVKLRCLGIMLVCFC